jgi:ribosomal protein S18 acetylase RimI-like enzyme
MLNKLISKLIQKPIYMNTNENILIALRVESNNISAIKCYKNVGFHKI